MFKNEMIRGIHATRFIASWSKVGGDFSHHRKGRNDFEKWLKSLGLNDDEVRFIINLATNGKLELENSAREFLTQTND